MTFSRGSSTLGPLAATTGQIRANTPMGESLRIMDMILKQTSAKLSTTFLAGTPFSPTAMMPKPKNSAMTMTWSMVASARGWKALEGKMFTRVSIRFKGSAGS